MSKPIETLSGADAVAFRAAILSFVQDIVDDYFLTSSAGSGSAGKIPQLGAGGKLHDSFLSAAVALLASPAFTGTPTAPTAAGGTNTTQLATTAFVQALLASPAFTGTPTAPTAALGTNTTQLSTTAFVQAAIAALVNTAPGTMDTLGEIAALIAADETTLGALVTTVAGKLAKASNLSDLTDFAAARTNLSVYTKAQIDATLGRDWQRDVMPTPPTIAVSTSHTLTGSPRGFLAKYAGNGGLLNPLIRYTRGSAPIAAGTSYPDYLFTQLSGVSYGTAGSPTLSTNTTGLAVMFDGAGIEFLIKGSGRSIWFKINDQYVSLTPTTMANDGSLYYVSLTFATAAMRRIELIANGQIRFGGIWIPEGSTLGQAPRRGPKTIVVGDSFVEGTGPASQVNAPLNVFADCLGWDDVRAAGVGSTGFTADASGTKRVYRDRLAIDVIPFAPDLVVLWGSINDGASAAATVASAAQGCIDDIKAALPLCQIALTSIMAAKGPGNTPANYYLVNDALRTVAVTNGLPFVDLLEQPLPENFTATATTLSSGASLGASTISTAAQLTPGATYKFADGSHVFVKSVSGSGPYTATLDYLPAAQSSGASVTPCGSGLWLGSGKVGSTTGFGNADTVVCSDGTHPSDAGGTMIGTALAFGLLRAAPWIADIGKSAAQVDAAILAAKPIEQIIIACSDEVTALTAGTAKITLRLGYAFTLSGVRASLATAQASGSIFTVDINEAGTSVLSTKLTIDNTEKTSTTAATAAVISDASLADDAEITIDIDQVGDGTAKGLKIVLIGRRT